MSEICFRPIRRKDFEKARKFSIVGMNTDRYSDRKFDTYLYSKYFWLWELSKATRIIGAYEGDRMVGVLLAEMYGEKKAYRSLWDQLYIKAADFLMGLIYGGGTDCYGEANAKMLAQLKEVSEPEGEINFFVVDPERFGQGIGTKLLEELAAREKGKLVYVYTDSSCNYQFYDHRGFNRDGEEDIVLHIHGRDIPLTCYLYSKKL